MNHHYPVDRDQVARILEAINAGSPGAEGRLLELVHGELKAMATARLRGSADCSLSPTALVNEAYIKLFGHTNPAQWSGRGHFFGAAAQAMRQILIDHARAKKRQKRGGNLVAVDLDIAQLGSLQNATVDELLDLDDALKQLAGEDPKLVELAELRFFAGQTLQEAADNLGMSLRTANRAWKYARARLWQFMSSEQRD